MTTQVKIEKNVPIPPVNRAREAIWPWPNMVKGDSALFVCKTQAEKSRVTSAVYYYRSKHAPKSKWTVRSVENGLRVWRTA